MKTQPKKTISNIKLRNNTKGNERRRNLTRRLLDKAPSFPLTVTYNDIDQCMFDWLDKELDFAYDGDRFPTYKLFSIQRLSEYGQNWEKLDEKGNLIINFKTITRESNPKHGDSQGIGMFNIPGRRDYPLFEVPSLMENGKEAIDLYSIKEPLAINLVYTISVITNKYNVLNDFNQLVHTKFGGLQCYIFPNGYAMPLTLTDVADDSEYAIDDRKYYSQSYSMKLNAFIIQQSDLKVTKLPSRYPIKFVGEGMPKKNNVKYNIGINENINNNLIYSNGKLEVVNTSNNVNTQNEAPSDKVENNSDFINKKYIYKVLFKKKKTTANFIVENDCLIETIETENISNFTFILNNIIVNFSGDEFRLYKGDIIDITIEYEEIRRGANMTIVTYDPKIMVSKSHISESVMDSEVKAEIITIDDTNITKQEIK